MSLLSEILAAIQHGKSRGMELPLGALEDIHPRATVPAIETRAPIPTAGDLLPPEYQAAQLSALERQLARASQLREPNVNAQFQEPYQPTMPFIDIVDTHNDAIRGVPGIPERQPRLEGDMPRIPEDAIQHENGRPRVADIEIAQAQKRALELPTAEEMDALPHRPMPELPTADTGIEAVEPQLHPGVLADPSVILDQTPVLQKIRQMMNLQRGDADAGVMKRLELARSLIGQKFANAEAVAGKNVPTGQRVGVDELGRYSHGQLDKLEGQLKGNITDVEGADKGLGTHGIAIARILKSFNRMMAIDPRSAVSYLAEAMSGTKGEGSDFAGEAGADFMLKTNSRANRRAASRNFRNADQARAIAGQAKPTLRGLESVQSGGHSSMSGGLYDNIRDPESVTGMRPGAVDDQFENVKSGRMRSVVLSEKELQENKGLAGQAMTKGSTIILSNGESHIVPATVVDIRKINHNNAAEVGVRQGIAPPTMRRMLKMRGAREGQLYEVVFQPHGSDKPGLADPNMVKEAVTQGERTATEAYTGVDANNPRPEFPVISGSKVAPRGNEQWFRDNGYNVDEVNFDTSKGTGAPYILKGKDLREAWTKEKVEALAALPDNPTRRARLAHARAALEDPSKGNIVNEDQIRRKTTSQFKNQRRDARDLGQGPNLGSAELGDTFPDRAPGELPAGTRVKGLVTGKNQHGTFSYSLDGGETWADRIFQTSEEARKAGHVAFLAEHPDQVQALRPTVTKDAQGRALPEATANTVGSRPTDRRDNEFRPSSVGTPTVDPVQVVKQMRAGQAPQGSFFLAEHYKSGFAHENADAGLSVGLDALQRAGDPKAVGGAVANINQKIGAAAGKARKKIILSINGPDAYALRNKPVDAKAMAQLLDGVANHPGRGYDIVGVITEGQPGIQEAANKAAKQLGIPTLAAMPPKYTMRHPGTGLGLWVPRELQEARFLGHDVSKQLDYLEKQARANIARAKARNQ